MNGYTVLYDPEGHLAAELPLDRTTHEHVARAVLTWSDPDALVPDDYEQVGLLLAGAARAVADDVRALAVQLPEHDGRRLFAEFVMGQADDCLARPSRNLLRVRDRARTLRALYERLDRLQGTAPAAETTTTASP
ncbi:restriction endonuclease [Streptomyces sp. MBT56]|uniref:restriction endonuclease n=1 Tax=unclassified Streptomyces TaxID=2593676 RepID=UPI00190BE481|nr:MULTISPECIES: restriction endonuclease [unclassified Streptomyces]MBK3559635.1 restriction endonuclease [Streptomyces sp. MBT56]MBK3601873.1 restriction endonuclease [Streptomyces sp. MBT54]MBK3618963.1 restriction endonuclease [Streptomyces sp. MBT98]MBK3625846.1 restriction endonuclease [Streptomyces sp. MBT49]